ncbi:hypothetical protein PRUPE_8G211300 [Prunus persica]|uniref:R13L1/DRL21-like LRR repeat region domain-containing protein n=1 Tax=Prunus persica TaxID=3760 RepID=M5W7R5_PRUPE|nr:hypothetical protein PRUPE_8G211300 [Prunus persica]
MEAADMFLSPALQVMFDRLAYPALEKVAHILGVEDNRDSLRDALMRTQVILQDVEQQQLTNKSTLNLICCHNLETLPFLENFSLRHLNLSGSVSLTFMHYGIKRFRQLQTLPLFVASQRLNISRLEKIEDAIPRILVRKENLESLGLYWGTKFPDWALPNLVAADFTNCRRSEYLPALGNLPLLKTFSLHGMDGVKKIEWSSANDENALCRLKKLTVKNCPKLAHISLPQSLQHLELRDCNPTMVPMADLNLVSLPEGLFASASLSSLKILSCPKLHSMPLHMQNLSSLKSLTSCCLQNLKARESLEISDCHSLTSLPNCGIAGVVSLRTSSIENCSELTSLSSRLEQLTLLKHLTIMYYPKRGSFPAGVQHLSSLRSLIVLDCPCFDSLPEGLENVKTLHCLEMSSCPNLTALPEWFEDLRHPSA